VFTFGEVWKFQSPSKLLDPMEVESLKNKMTSKAEKAQYVTLGEVLKFQSPSKLFDSLEG
jgi:hypothetical protein